MVDYENIKKFVAEKHKEHPFAGYDHVERVHDLCMELSKGLDVDMDVLRVAAYLHDIAVPVHGPQNHYQQAEEVAGSLLTEWSFPEEKHQAVFEAIKSHTRYHDVVPTTLEGEILKDADGIDYLGATGILRGVIRGFRAGEYKGNVTEDGEQLLADLIEKADNTFYTERGKEMAAARVAVINGFIETLKAELKGEC